MPINLKYLSNNLSEKGGDTTYFGTTQYTICSIDAFRLSENFDKRGHEVARDIAQKMSEMYKNQTGDIFWINRLQNTQDETTFEKCLYNINGTDAYYLFHKENDVENDKVFKNFAKTLHNGVSADIYLGSTPGFGTVSLKKGDQTITWL